jgi:FixJ family two-component response regulator
MDLTIPGAMGGKEAMTEFLKIDQNAKVIVVSGYANAPIVTNYKEYGFSAAATKPIDFLGLADEIDRLITSDKSLTRKV